MEVKLQLKERDESFAVYMTDIEDPCIFGMDYVASSFR